MDSTGEYDPTLPLDMNGSSVNITRFNDNSVVGLTAAMSDPGNSQMTSANLFTMPDGRMSPSSSRTMKDFATQISDLKKENFSLKLRIFYMEERMQDHFDQSSEEVFKTNIELKVDCDSLRKELQDKHELLIRASNAVACMEGGPEEIRQVQKNAEKELQQMRDVMNEKAQQSEKELRATRAEADNLAVEIQQLQEYTHKLESDNQKLKEDLDDAAKEADALRGMLPKEGETVMSQDEAASVHKLTVLERDIIEKDRIIEQLQEGLAVKQTMIEALSDEKRNDVESLDSNKDIIADLKVRNKALDDELKKVKIQGERLKAEYTQHIAEQQQRLDEFEIAARQMSEELEKREEEVKDLTDALQDAEETSKELADNYDKLRDDKGKKDAKEIVMRDKAISGLTEVVRKKDEEIESLQSEAQRREMRLEELSETIRRLSSQEVDVQDRIQKLRDMEQLVKELKNVKRDLEMTNKRLVIEVGNSEELVRSLDEKLKEKDKDLQELVNKYKDLLRKHQDDEKAKTRAVRDQEEMAGQFEKEKEEFGEIMNIMKKQLEQTTGNNLNDARMKDIAELQEKLCTVENLLRLKEAQLQESVSLCKRAENERKEALEALEAATKRRDSELYRETESRTRINAAKSAEIERLREELRSKDEHLQNLEDDLLHAERSAHDATEKSIIAGREAARWKDDSQHKDSVIEELMDNLKALGETTPNSEQEQIVKLTRENVELKQLLKAKEAELSFLRDDESPSSPYVESLKREIARKDKILADERSKISEDTTALNAMLDTLRSEIEERKRELITAKNQINSLSAQLESSKMEMMALREECKTKDRMLEDQRSLHRGAAVESEDGSSIAMDKLAKAPNFAHGRMQKFTKKKSKRQKLDDEFSIVSSSTNSLMRYNTDNEFDYVSSGRDSPALRRMTIHPELNMELLNLHKEIEDLKGAQRSEIDLQKISSKLDLQKERLRRLAESLTAEQELYRKQLNVTRRRESVGATIGSQREKLLDGILLEVEDLRNKLADLLLDVPHEADYEKMGETSGASSTILPVNQTSYLQVPLLEMKNLTNGVNRQKEIEDLKNELETTRNELDDARSKLLEWEKVKRKLQQENNETKENLRKVMEESDLQDIEMSALRIEVDELRKLQLTVTKASEAISEDETDGMGTLSRIELCESIDNLKKKLKNAERLNELLGDQIESAREDKSARHADEAKLTRQLSLQIGKLQEQLKTSQQQLNAVDDRGSKSYHPLSSMEPKFARANSKSKLPIPVDKALCKKADSLLADKDTTDFAKIKAENTQLQKKLAATEETVRQQTEKLKKAKAAMAAAGLDVPLSPVKSARSHPNLFFSENGPGTSRQQVSSDNADGRVQLSADDTGYASVTPRSERRYNSLIQAQAKELSTLRQRLKRARETCKNLKTEYDIIQRYVSTLVASNISVDKMLASSVTNELQRCKQLTRKLKGQLAEWISDASSSDSDGSISSPESSPVQRQTSQLLQKSKELSEKNQKIHDLEAQLNDLIKQYSEPSFEKSKSQRIIPENLGYLTPASSRDEREDMLSPVMRPSLSRNTEYAALPERKTPRPRSMINRLDQQPLHSSPKLNRSLPMYQRTIACTEYLPCHDSGTRDGVTPPGRRRLSTTSDAENCTASYGGCWTLGISPRQGQEARLSFNPEVTVHSSPTQKQDIEADRLKRELESSERLNESLKEELEIATQALDEATNVTRPNKTPAEVLEEHLGEIRILRQRLENSINTNDRLRQQLEWKLKQTPNDHVSANIYLPVDTRDGVQYVDELDQVKRELLKANEEITKLKNQLDAEVKMKDDYAAVLNELEQMKVHVVEISTQTEMVGTDVDDLENAMEAKDEEILKLQKDVEHVEEELKAANDRNEVNLLEADVLRQNADEAIHCAASVKDDLNRVNEELDESHGLVRSLKSELTLYEKYYKNKGIPDAKSLRSVSGQTSNGKYTSYGQNMSHEAFDPMRSTIEQAHSRQGLIPSRYASEQMQTPTCANPVSSRLTQAPSNMNRNQEAPTERPYPYQSFDPLYSTTRYRTTNPDPTYPQNQPKWDFDITEFLDEIRSLRIQLERSIEINSALRRQLQEQLQHDKDAVSIASPGRTTTINIHHMSPHQRNATNGEGTYAETSPESCCTSARRKLDLSKDQPSNFPITPPPSASSFGDDGFEFATLPSSGSHASKRNPNNKNLPLYDSHGPYVVGKRKDYKALRQIVSDGRMLLHNMGLKAAGQAVGMSLKQQPDTFDDGHRILQKIFEDCRRLLKLFWPASLPASAQFPGASDTEHEVLKNLSRRSSGASSDFSKGTRDAGFASDTSINSDADGLRREVRKLHKRLSAQDKLLQSTVDRLQSANRLKEGIEHAILKQLTVTHDVLKQARGNLEAKTGDSNSKEKPTSEK